MGGYIGQEVVFRDLLRETGMTQAELARRVDYTPNAINMMHSGKTPPNGAVMAYLNMFIKLERFKSNLRAAIEK